MWREWWNNSGRQYGCPVTGCSKSYTCYQDLHLDRRLEVYNERVKGHQALSPDLEAHELYCRRQVEEREGLARIPCVVNSCSRTFAPGKDQARSSIKRHCSERGIAGDAEHLEEYRNMEGDGTGVTIERRVVMPEVVMPEEKGCGI